MGSLERVRRSIDFWATPVSPNHPEFLNLQRSQNSVFNTESACQSQRLGKLGKPIGPAIKQLITIVTHGVSPVGAIGEFRFTVVLAHALRVSLPGNQTNSIQARGIALRRRANLDTAPGGS